MPRQKPRLVIFFGGDDPTYQLSRDTGYWLCQYMPRDHYNITPVHVLPDGRWQVPLGNLPQQGSVQRMMEHLFAGIRAVSPRDGWQRLLHKPVDALFSVLRGRGGDDGGLHQTGSLFNIPVLGSNAKTCHQTYHKQLLQHAIDDITAMPSSLFFEATTPVEEAVEVVREEMLAPLFVKPAAGEGSAGIVAVDSLDDLHTTLRKALAQGDVLVQERARGTELSITLMPDGRGRTIVLPPTIVVPKHAAFYDALAKQREGRVLLHTSDHHDSPLLYEAVTIADEVYQRLGADGYASFDFVADEDSVDLLEVNTVPIFNNATPFKQQLAAAQIHPASFVDALIKQRLT